MKRRINILLLLCVLTLTTELSAQKVSRQDAHRMAMHFIGQKQGQTRAVSDMQLQEVNSGAENVYAFNVGEGEGFVLVSGDERTMPILGYSDQGSFDLTNAPENLRSWMKGYEAEIDALESGLVTEAATRATVEPYGPSVKPLLKTQWDQGDPYNLYTPFIEYKQTPTGCGATAMAQVMNYWKSPTHAIASMPGYKITLREIDIPGINNTFIDWQNMCDTYTQEDNRTEEQKKAVATLMRYVGQSVKMDYSHKGSGAYLSDIARSLKEYFGYAESVTYLRRSEYSTKEWETMVYNELSAGRPVVYCGFNDDGHAFVCDGYDRDRYFHINWGWGGLADGNFLLSVLNPGTNAGIGASLSPLGYNRSQQMVIGITPSDHVVGEVPTLKMYNSAKFLTKQNVLRLSTLNISSRNGVFEVALVKKDTEGGYIPIDSTGWLTNDTITVKYYNVAPSGIVHATFPLDLSDMLATGEYLLYPMVRCISVPGDEWHQLLPPGQGLLYTVPTEGSTCKIYPAFGLQVEDLIYENRGAFQPHEAKFAISNHGSLDYSDEVTLSLRYQDPENKYESVSRQSLTVGAYIDVNATDSVVFNFIPPRGGECAYELYTSDSLQFASGTMFFDEPREEILNAVSIRDYEIYYNIDKYFGYNMIFIEAIAKNASPATFMGSLVFDLTISGEEVMHINIEASLMPNSERKIDDHQFFYNKNLKDDDEIDLVLRYRFSPFYTDLILLTGKLYADKILTPDGNKDNVTGISEVQTQQDKKTRIIDLMGNEINDAGEVRGLYIVNGKKVIRK